MTKLLNGAFITGQGKLNGLNIATEYFVEAAIAGISFDQVVESSETSLADYITAHGTGISEGTLLILANAASGAQRFVRRDHAVSNAGTSADFINISTTSIANGSITQSMLSSSLAAIISDAMGRAITFTGDGSETDFEITHNAGTKDLIVGVRDMADDEIVFPTVKTTTTNMLTVSFAEAPANGKEYRVIIKRVTAGVMGGVAP